MFKYNNILLVAIAIASCFSLLLSSNLIPAYAISITLYDSTGNDTLSIARLGTSVFIGDEITDSVYKRSVNDLTTNTATITGVTDPRAMKVNLAGTRLYVFGSGATPTLYELDPVNNAILRTVVPSCTGIGSFQSDADFFWCADATELVKKVSFSSMSVVFTSTTLNAGAVACDSVGDLWYHSTTDTLFAGCLTGTARIVAVEGITASGTPDFAATISTVNSLAFNKDQSNLTVCSGSSTFGVKSYNYTAGVGFTVWNQMVATGTANICASNAYEAVQYDTTSNRYFLINSAADTVNVFDGTTTTSLLGSIISPNGISGGMISVFSNSKAYIGFNGGLTTEDFADFDMTGLALGGSGSQSGGGGSGDLDCTLPENENILTCRLGGDGTLVGAGQFIVGNVNGTTGLTPIICATGIVDCVANPDMKTNGVGYLLVTIALAIIIGILWVASRGDLNSIPTFIWFVATLAVVGAFTLMDLIDATFLVITAIIVIALAAAKVRGLFGGEFR